MKLEEKYVQTLATQLATVSLAGVGIAADVQGFPRQLVATDPNYALGVALKMWRPLDSPNMGSWEPTIARYTFAIQTLVKDPVRVTGDAISREFSREVRNMLLRSETLRNALANLRDDVDPVERAIRFSVERQEFDDSPISSGFIFLSQTEFCLDTDTP